MKSIKKPLGLLVATFIFCLTFDLTNAKEIIEEQEQEVVEVQFDETIGAENEVEVVEEVPSPFFYEISPAGYITEDSLRSICDYVGNEYALEPELLQAIAYVESTYNVNATSPYNAKGLCQIVPKWNQDKIAYLEIYDIYDPISNVMLCAEIITDHIEFHEYGSDMNFVLMAYNMGAGPAAKLYSQGTVTGYAKRVMSKYEEIKGGI